jgi:hypothetical protein
MVKVVNLWYGFSLAGVDSVKLHFTCNLRAKMPTNIANQILSIITNQFSDLISLACN